MTMQPAAAAGVMRLGGTLNVNRLGFGAMRLTGANVWGNPQDIPAAHRVLRRALELGVNFIDTADSYGPHTNESLIAAALHPYPADLVIATKGGLVRPAPERWERNAHPKQLRIACEGSLRRLRIERIDLYQLHAPDPAVPLEDSIAELARMQAEGKIRYLGLSNVNVDELRRASRMIEVVSVQNRYHIGDRAHDAVLEYCQREAIAFIPWGPLGGARTPSQQAELDRLKRERSLTTSQASIAWLLDRSPVVLPIPGTASIGHLEENVAAARRAGTT